MYSSKNACFKHSNFFQSKGPGSPRHPIKDIAVLQKVRNWLHQFIPREARPMRQSRNSTTSFLTATTLIYAIGAGITAAAGTRLASNCSSLRDLNCTHSNYETRKSPVLLFIVTTSPCRDWVICAPAAFLGCGSRFSGSLSGIEP